MFCYPHISSSSDRVRIGWWVGDVMRVEELTIVTLPLGLFTASITVVLVLFCWLGYVDARNIDIGMFSLLYHDLEHCKYSNRYILLRQKNFVNV